MTGVEQDLHLTVDRQCIHSWDETRLTSKRTALFLAADDFLHRVHAVRVSSLDVEDSTSSSLGSDLCNELVSAT
jgi:hypothetical protein